MFGPSSSSTEPLLTRLSFSVDHSAPAAQMASREKLERKKRRKWKRKLLMRHHRGHWEEMIRGTFPVFVAASVNMVVQQILDMIVGSGGIALQLVVNFLYACGVAHTLGYAVAYYVPASNPAAEYYSSLVSDNAAFAWSSFLTLVIMNWLYSDYPAYAAVLAWVLLVGFVGAFIYFSNYLQTTMWHTAYSVRRRLRDFESDCFALAIAYSFTVIIAASLYHDSATDYLSNTDDLDSNVPDPSDSTDDRQTYLGWVFFVYTACITIALVAYQWQLDKYIHRKTMQRQRELLLHDHFRGQHAALSTAVASTAANNSSSSGGYTFFHAPTTLSPLGRPSAAPTEVGRPVSTAAATAARAGHSYNVVDDSDSDEDEAEDVEEVERALSSSSSDSDSDSDSGEDGDGRGRVQRAAEAAEQPAEFFYTHSSLFSSAPGASRWRLSRRSLRKRCIQCCLPWDQPVRHCAMSYKRCFYTSVAYTVGCAWHIWCQLSFTTYFRPAVGFGHSVAAYAVFAVLASVVVAWCLTIVTWQKEWAGLRTLPTDHLQYWFEMEGILYLTCGRLTVGWAWNTLFSDIVSTLLVPGRDEIDSHRQRAGLVLGIRLLMVLGFVYGGYAVEMFFYRHRQRQSKSRSSSSASGRGGAIGMGLIAGDDPARQRSADAKL
eukprot:gene7285-5238_t